MKKLLYTKEGVDWACKVWCEFVEGRKRWLGRGEGGKFVGREEEWGWGELER